MSKIEQRVVGANRPKVGAQRIGAARQAQEAEPAPEEKPKKKRTLWVLLAAIAAVGIGAALYFVVFAGDSADAEPQEPVPGVVQPVDAMSLNLVDGHYLRLGLGLQLVDGVANVDESRARDAAIALFSGRSVKEVSSEEGRAKLKAALATELAELYDGDVIGVYLTDFVTQ